MEEEACCGVRELVGAPWTAGMNRMPANRQTDKRIRGCRIQITEREIIGKKDRGIILMK
ncbi:hypothetical protein HMPREF3038_02274 [Akkermansia sp. KLE1797]|nr:hypothetical protein HMPREF3038_02274 [Akkermansia sp. KLE1797]KXU53236.1 hypothetical protein HMPREF3039_02646 [Akkermansia sp. KLE1798]KZA05323.1 hypothetical protein HMPREF1326_00937 [Akkermansia sp. KLE1605]